MVESISAEIVQKLEALIEEVEEQYTRMRDSRESETDEITLVDLMATLEQLHAFRDRFYATVH